MCDDDNSSETPQPEYYRFLYEKTSTGDLQKLLKCEHPVLRAFAISLLVRKEVNIDKLLLTHLDDTAVITTCMGEFGTRYTTVSDHFLFEAQWNTRILKTTLINEVITNHPYLDHAYGFISALEKPEEKYYEIIKKMTKASDHLRGYDNMYSNKESGLYALAKYKKAGDIPYISDQLYRNWRLFSSAQSYSFIIIKENPDTNYFKVLERFYRSISYQTTNEELQYDFYSSWTKLADKYEAFLSALATYKNKRSSEMIDTIIKRKLYPQYNMDRISQNYEFTIYNLLKENECSVYQGLIKQLEYRGKAFNKQIDTDEIPEMDANYDTTFSSKHDERYW